MAFGKPNNTGRSSGKLVGRQKKLHSPPQGEPWAWQTRELMTSAAWQAMSFNARLIIDALQIEHMNHAGQENGDLMCTHEQLRAAGVTSTCIRPAIEELEFLGLIRYQRGGRWAGTNQPSLYRLTFYADKWGNPATNEWKRVIPEQIKDWQAERRQVRTAVKKRKAALTSRRSVS